MDNRQQNRFNENNRHENGGGYQYGRDRGERRGGDRDRDTNIFNNRDTDSGTYRRGDHRSRDFDRFEGEFTGRRESGGRESERAFSDDMGSYGETGSDRSDNDSVSQSFRTGSLGYDRDAGISPRQNGGEGYRADREQYRRGGQFNYSGERFGDQRQFPGTMHESGGTENGNRDRNRGQHYGKGPKGFAFSDEELKKEISRELYRHGDIDASEVTIEVKDGEVTLSGTVDSRGTRRLIEEYVEDEVPGVTDVSNQIRVKRGGESSGSSTGKEIEKASTSSAKK